MNKKICLLPALLLMLLSFTSCSETNEVDQYANWQPRNQAFLDSLQHVIDTKSDPNLFVITPMSSTKYKIYAKKVDGYVGQGNPALFTDTVLVHYKGQLINGEIFDKTFEGINPDLAFDVPRKFVVYTTNVQNSILTGWTEVLQLMRKGDRWKVYIPYQLAYGTSGSGAIPGSSTLIFDMNMVNLWHPK